MSFFDETSSNGAGAPNNNALKHTLLTKKYDSGYKEMYGTLNRAMNLKNDNSSYFEEKTLEELKEKINSRINAIKGN